MTQDTYRPVVLVVLDGWGLTKDPRSILNTMDLPTITTLSRYYPFASLQASGISVGLPWGEAGNSEVGHITLGAGRIIYQNLPRISLAIQNESFFMNEALLRAITHIRTTGGTLHLMGLLSSGAVHSHYDHLLALIELARRNGITSVAIHPFTDGRDSAPTSGVDVMQQLQRDLIRIGIGKIATVSGRHWSMDRNNNWERTERSYRMLCGDTEKTATATDPVAYMRASYDSGTTDEFIAPAIIVDPQTHMPLSAIADNDAVIFFNFREDRARQITKALCVPTFTDFDRFVTPTNLCFVTLTSYEKDLPVFVAFPPEIVAHTLGEVLSDCDKSQLRIAETEKYAHVTYFFNGGAEQPYPGEDRVLIPSPSVSRFDEAPEMSAAGVTERVVAALSAQKYDFILINYANADMVGHTGNEQAARAAVRAIDKTLSLLIPAVLRAGGALLITADHGNIEVLYNEKTGAINTEHSTNPVPIWFVTPDNHRENPCPVTETPPVIGLLSDIAPTILSLLHLPVPREMHGQSLVPFLKK